MKTGKYLILAFVCFFLFGSGRSDEPTEEFTGDLLKALYASNGGGANTVFSSASLYIVLSLLEQGGRGTTQQELTRVLHADASATRQDYSTLVRQLRSVGNGTTLEIANSIYLETGFNIEPSFRQVALNSFDAGIDNIEFKNAASAADTINQWVSDNTHGRITKLLSADDVSPDTEAMLLNAVYFNGQWQYSFDANGTLDSPFTALSGTKSTAPMMHLQDNLAAGELEIGARFVRLPFKDNDFSMIVVVPNAVDGLEDVVNQLQQDHLVSIINGGQVRKVDLKMPKFKFSTTSKLVPTLKQLGLNNVFTRAADLTGIARTPPLEVSDVVQIAEIEVDEKGATASAVTVVGGHGRTAAVVRIPDFFTIVADHPFAFFIIYNPDSLPLFSGWVGQP